ncbi:hypothetical protein GWI33_007730 [Rhynchophorus ferrugineus]|uniref:Uncharacterized protein n=1 Tax=Rhynchophorus ferrugineus TaxID=354439 RepID=A0A834IFQ5_RHYFE|nr:hypothetical protein GWI33_007730 [Rhynchophorus ferrugineus]
MDEETYSSILKEKEHDKSFLSNLLFSHGFCSNKEKMGFFNGDLDISDHVDILYRIFKFVDRLKKSPTDKQSLSLDSLNNLINTDLNIIPGFGGIKPFTEVEKAAKTQAIQQEIKELQEKINDVADVAEKNMGIVVKQSNENYQDILDSMKDNLRQFDRIVKAIDKDKSTAIRSNYKIDPKSAELLETCNKNLSLIAQYIEDLNTINHFNIDDTQDLKDDISPLIDLLAEQVQGISKFIYM